MAAFSELSVEILQQLLAASIQIAPQETAHQTRYLQTLDLQGVADYIKKCMSGEKIYNLNEKANPEAVKPIDSDTASQVESPIVNQIPLENSNSGNEVAEPFKDSKPFIVVMTGAGLSTAAGIPDFRSPESGLYARFQKEGYGLPAPEAVFSLEYFKENPKPFMKLAKELYPLQFKPTKSHFFITLLQRKGLLMRLFTQNIDGLERMAGIENTNLIEAHGSFHSAACVMCNKSHDIRVVQEKIMKEEEPRCDACEGLVKPSIVFFGEPLPDRYQVEAKENLPKCRLLLILGTSLKVYPFAGLVDMVTPDCPRLLMNREEVTGGDMLMKMVGKPSGLVFGDKAYRDVFSQGDCDKSCELLAEYLGWKEELNQFYAEEIARLDQNILNDPFMKYISDSHNTTAGNSASDEAKQKTTSSL